MRQQPRLMQPSRQRVMASNTPLQRAARARALRRETPLQHYNDDGIITEGVVDLAFLEFTADFDGWTVVDFKTDRELKNAEEQYRAQLALNDIRQPVMGSPLVASQGLELPMGPSCQNLVDVAQGGIEGRLVVTAVVVDPAADVTVEHPCKIIQRQQRTSSEVADGRVARRNLTPGRSQIRA